MHLLQSGAEVTCGPYLLPGSHWVECALFDHVFIRPVRGCWLRAVQDGCKSFDTPEAFCSSLRQLPDSAELQAFQWCRTLLAWHHSLLATVYTHDRTTSSRHDKISVAQRLFAMAAESGSADIMVWRHARNGSFHRQQPTDHCCATGPNDCPPRLWVSNTSARQVSHQSVISLIKLSSMNNPSQSV